MYLVNFELIKIDNPLMLYRLTVSKSLILPVL